MHGKTEEWLLLFLIVIAVESFLDMTHVETLVQDNGRRTTNELRTTLI